MKPKNRSLGRYLPFLLLTAALVLGGCSGNRHGQSADKGRNTAFNEQTC